MLLEVKNLKLGYGKREVVHGLSIALDSNEIVVLIGHNGAGKTTSLKGIFGLLKPLGGRIDYNGREITGRPPRANLKDGLAFIPQDRFIFPGLTVAENLQMGAYAIESKHDLQSKLDVIHELFPILRERSWQQAATLSGGERRMLGIGMALITRPRLLLLDEPSLGLSPLLVQTLMKTLKQIQESLGTSILLVEQNVQQALQVGQRVYIMKMGSVILEESGKKLLQRGQWWDLF